MGFDIRTANTGDLPRILQIYAHARAYMRQQGNHEQWNGNYPPEDLLLEDIRQGHLYLCTDGDQIAGVFYYREGPDPTYLKIYEGSWPDDQPYGVIHRIAVADHRKGVASFCFEYGLSRCPRLRIDTHRDNIPMQRSLSKNGFTRCGIILLANGDERIAYQKNQTEV
ncbi:MAG: GNAT family N-acetyltransferase [Oscillospiraceae bacterium]|nr:GNAT family N-acetyltransferase [Oscillospiraceae bacterium]